MPGGRTIVIRDEIPDDLIFLPFRCFLEDRSSPSQGGSIRAGQSQSYRVTISPPPREPPSPDLASSESSFEARERAHCRRTTLGAQGGAYTDCLSALLQMLNNPGSDIPRPWGVDDSKIWNSPNCRIILSFHGFPSAPDYFSERSLINNAVWIMARCFAGPEAHKQANEGFMSVGPRRQCTLRMFWGLSTRGSSIEGTGNSTSGTGIDTGLISPAATLQSAGSNTES